MSEALAQCSFAFDGFSCHEFFIAERIRLELRGSVLFDALDQKFGLCTADVAHAVLRYVPFEQVIQLLATSNIVSVVSALLPLILPAHFSFQQARAAHSHRTVRSAGFSLEADASAVAAAIVADILHAQ